MAEYVCDRCGAPCGQDARMGSLDVYLLCNCNQDAHWIDDGRGGYYDNTARPVEVPPEDKR